MALRRGGKAVDQRGKFAVFAGLNEAEVALGQGQRGLARQRAEDGNIEHGDGVGDERAVAFAADAVEDHARDVHRRIVRGKASHQGRGRLRLPRDIEHEQDRQAKMRSEVGRRATLPGCCRGAVEQAHDAFDHDDIGAVRRLRGERVEKFARHRPAIQIDARRTGDGGVERRIDVIGSRFRRAHDRARAAAAPP